MSFICFVKSSFILFQFWPGTNLIEIFAKALLGKTVLAPSSVYPPHIPLTSNAGLIDCLSIVEKPTSPCSLLSPIESLNSSILKGVKFISFLSFSETSITLS